MEGLFTTSCGRGHNRATDAIHKTPYLFRDPWQRYGDGLNKFISHDQIDGVLVKRTYHGKLDILLEGGIDLSERRRRSHLSVAGSQLILN